MNDSVLTHDEFLSKAKISEKLLLELEAEKIITPSGFTEKNVPFYTSNSLEHLASIKKLLEMGYGLDEINRITRKVGLPKAKKTNKQPAAEKRLTVGGLAERVGISTRTIKHWEEMGIIEADMRSEGGFRLYSEIYIYLCNLIKDLQLFGYSLEEIKKISDQFRLFLQIEADINRFSKKETEQKLNKMLREISQLHGKMKQLKEGINRWEELLNKKTKEINNFKRKNLKRAPVKKGGKNG